MQAKTVQLPSAALAYEKYGDGDVGMVLTSAIHAERDIKNDVHALLFSLCCVLHRD